MTIRHAPRGSHRRSAGLGAAVTILVACAPSPQARDAGVDVRDGSADTIDASPAVSDRGNPGDLGRDAARVRPDVSPSPRCYGVRGAPGLLEHVGSIPRESGGLSNGGSGCVGDVDGDGRREYVLPRMAEPSELIGADLCSRGRVLLPEHARDCVVADVDGLPGDELVVLSSVGWTAESRVTVGRVERATPADWTAERYVWRELAAFDERRPVSPIGAPHAVVTDLDGDGRAELAVSGNYPAAFVRSWERGADRWEPHFAQDLAATLDDTNGLLAGDVDGDGAAEVVVLGGCTRAGRHLLRVFGAWSPERWSDTELAGPAVGALADLDGVAPPELVLTERVSCGELGPAPTSALQVRRYDPATGTLALVAARVTANATRESAFAVGLDVVGSAAQEVLLCTAPMSVAAPPRTCRLFALRDGSPATLEPVPSEAVPFVWTSPARRAVLSSVLVDDLDGDGAREVFVQGQEHVDVLRGPQR